MLGKTKQRTEDYGNQQKIVVHVLHMRVQNRIDTNLASALFGCLLKDYLRCGCDLVIKIRALVGPSSCVFRTLEESVHIIGSHDDFAQDLSSTVAFTIASHSCWNLSKVASQLIRSNA